MTLQSQSCARLTVVLTLLLLCSCAMLTGAAPMTEQQLIRKCGSATECVKIVASTRISIIIDELNLTRDSVERVVDRVPAWFGPQERPIALELNGKRLEPRTPLAEQGVSVGTELRLVSAAQPPSSDADADASADL